MFRVILAMGTGTSRPLSSRAHPDRASIRQATLMRRYPESLIDHRLSGPPSEYVMMWTDHGKDASRAEPSVSGGAAKQKKGGSRGTTSKKRIRAQGAAMEAAVGDGPSGGASGAEDPNMAGDSTTLPGPATSKKGGKSSKRRN